jgi:hypothetical protein
MPSPFGIDQALTMPLLSFARATAGAARENAVVRNGIASERTSELIVVWATALRA